VAWITAPPASSGAVNECADNKNGNEGVKEADKRQKSHAGEGHFEVGMLVIFLYATFSRRQHSNFRKIRSVKGEEIAARRCCAHRHAEETNGPIFGLLQKQGDSRAARQTSEQGTYVTICVNGPNPLTLATDPRTGPKLYKKDQQAEHEMNSRYGSDKA